MIPLRQFILKVYHPILLPLGRSHRWLCLLMLTFLTVIVSSQATAQTSPQSSPEVTATTIWVLLSGCLVFFMNCGFAMVETGFCRRGSSITILAKNTIVFSIATLIFWIVGFAFMFGNGSEFIGLSGFLLPNNINLFNSLNFIDRPNVPLYAKFFFQLTLAGVSAIIVSGAVAERIKFGTFIQFSVIFVILYSITGRWAWGGGFLQNFGFRDFAGSMVVHGVGGAAALMGAWLLQPRQGKYTQWGDREKRSLRETSFYGNKIISIQGHNLSLATLGCFILWLGCLALMQGQPYPQTLKPFLTFS
jgi:Amt family ammonium transporter